MILCKIYKSEKTDIYYLKRLETYQKVEYLEDVHQPLVENIEEFSLVDNGVKFKFLYDRVVSIPYRDKTQKILKTVSAEIRIIDPQNKNLYIIYAPSKIADSIRVRLSRILSDSNSDDFIENITIPSDILKDIKDNDAIEVKYGQWDDIDTYARKGALGGNLLKSRYYNDFENSGKPTSIIFESKSTGRTIMITSKGIIIFYGKNLTHEEVEDYIIQQIIPRLSL